jgi:DNA ligase-associated metallophosphoesterase
MNFLNFGGNQFEAAGDTALYWPVQQMLLVADLHLEKASSFARGGQMLPPYDSLATLEKLERLIVLTGARTVICLGDNFHDHGAEGRLSGRAAEILKQLTSQIEWIWITGNHDPQIEAAWGGRSMDELVVGDITLRHEAQATFANLEISGHYHPKFRVNFNRRNVARRLCPLLVHWRAEWMRAKPPILLNLICGTLVRRKQCWRCRAVSSISRWHPRLKNRTRRTRLSRFLGNSKPCVRRTMRCRSGYALRQA